MNRVLVSIVFLLLSCSLWCVVVCENSADGRQLRATACNTTDCNDNNACTADSCDKVNGCQHVPTVCDDANPCTTDICDAKTGCVHYAVSCNDYNACTTESCNPSTGCVSRPVSCDDNNACTIDTCNTTTGCVNRAISCDDNNMCTVDTCSATTGCSNQPVNCDDGNLCTTDSCSATTGCIMLPVNCDDGNSCTIDTCSARSGCTYTPKANCNTDPCSGSCAKTGGMCSNSSGSYRCTCKSGFSGDGYTCNDVNECANASTCGTGMNCTNTVGSYSCTDIDECANTSTCSTGLKCTNTVGSYSCSARRYFIRSVASGLVMTGGADGANVLMTNNKTANFDDQLWSYVPMGGEGVVQNVRTGYVLDIKNGNGYAGAAIITWDKKLTGWSVNQQWRYDSLYFGDDLGYVLDVQGASSAPNTPVIVWTKNSPPTTNQQFYLVEYV